MVKKSQALNELELKLKYLGNILYELLRCVLLKLVSAIFYQIFILHQMIALQKLGKMFLFHLKSSLSCQDIQFFVLCSSPLFFPVINCLRVWSKKNLKIYGIINCLNINLITFCLISWERNKVWHSNFVHWYRIK